MKTLISYRFDDKRALNAENSFGRKASNDFAGAISQNVLPLWPTFDLLRHLICHHGAKNYLVHYTQRLKGPPHLRANV